MTAKIQIKITGKVKEDIQFVANALQNNLINKLTAEELLNLAKQIKTNPDLVEMLKQI